MKIKFPFLLTTLALQASFMVLAIICFVSQKLLLDLSPPTTELKQLEGRGPHLLTFRIIIGSERGFKK